MLTHTGRNLLLRVLLPVLGLVSLGAMGGWGRDGHAIVAQIAYAELTPAARARVDAILGAEAMPEVASWPDTIRGEDDYRWTGPLHYANPSPEHESYDHARDCPPWGNVVSGVVDFSRVLGNEHASAADRREALIFVVHFVGDLHQPLHAGRAEDRGGNDISVTFFDRERNIHSIWDSGLMWAHSRDPWPFWVARLMPEIEASDRADWLAGFEGADAATVGAWVSESRDLAMEHCYVLGEGDVVGERYVQEKMPIVEVRLKQAGVRLGALLNAVLDPEG